MDDCFIITQIEKEKLLLFEQLNSIRRIEQLNSPYKLNQAAK